jgi:hypothetical protein
MLQSEEDRYDAACSRGSKEAEVRTLVLLSTLSSEGKYSLMRKR